ncbi:MAG: hypothetical protein V4736_09990 [Bdellovibrionota bacterium]
MNKLRNILLLVLCTNVAQAQILKKATKVEVPVQKQMPKLAPVSEAQNQEPEKPQIKAPPPKPIMVSFPIEELPSEVVTPLVDSPNAVESKLIRFKDRNEGALYIASQLDEAFYSGLLYGFRYTRHISEKWGFGLLYEMKNAGTSSNADSLSAEPNVRPNFDRAPQLKNRYALTSVYRFIYGKVSFGKEIVKPISSFARVDLGMGNYDGENLPYFIGSLNSQLFFTPKDAFTLELGIGYINQPNVLSKNLSANVAAAALDSYDKTWVITTELRLNYSRFF